MSDNYNYHVHVHVILQWLTEILDTKIVVAVMVAWAKWAGPRLLKQINFNPSMSKESHVL